MCRLRLKLRHLAEAIAGVIGLCSFASMDCLIAQEFLAPIPVPIQRVEETQIESTRAPISDFDQLRMRLDSVESQLKARVESDMSKKQTAPEKPSVNWTGQLQADWMSFSQDAVSKAAFGDIENGAAFRRARFGMFGEYDLLDYRIEMDFALAGRPTFQDVFVGIREVPWVGRLRAGHFFEPFSLERLTSNRFMTFLERNSGDQSFVPARNLGVMASNTYAEQSATWAVGLFRANSDVFGDDTGDEFESAITSRMTWLAWYEDSEGGPYFLHLGAAYSFRDANDHKVRFAAQPESRIGAATPNVPSFVDTHNIAAHNYQLAGLEAAWINGPLSVQSEYMLVPVNQIGGSTLLFDSWYVQASYFLTGEHRPYRRDNGTFDRVIPQTEFIHSAGSDCVEIGSGAWELALRMSRIDLNDGPVAGGRLTDFTVGLNWYLNRYLRVTANYIRAAAMYPVQRRTNTDIFGVRVGFDF